MAELFYCACGDYLGTLTPKSGDEVTVKVRIKGEAEVFIEYTEELFNLSVNRYKREKTYFLCKNGSYEYSCNREGSRNRKACRYKEEYVVFFLQDK